MKWMMLVLMAALPRTPAAESQADASGLPSEAIPKTMAVLVIETPRQGVTVRQVMTVIPDEIQATVKLYVD
jgi:hypothetical protein